MMFYLFIFLLCFGQIIDADESENSIQTSCELPPYPAHGSYQVYGDSSAKPRDVVSSAVLNVSCDPGFLLTGEKEPYCINGIWLGQISECVETASLCVLPPYPDHGTYSMVGLLTSTPGQAFASATLNVTCDLGYAKTGGPGDLLLCFGGIWAGEMPKCEPTATLCVLPPYPAHGTYTMVGLPTAVPGQAFASATLNVTCDPGYDLGNSEALLLCFAGTWAGEMPKCESTIIPCVLPPFPAHGKYVVVGAPSAVPGQTLATAALNISCDPGYDFEGDKERVCVSGIWSDNMTDCEALCRLNKDPSVEYRCLHSKAAVSEWQWSRECDQYERDGTVVRPQCKKNYFFPTALSPMRCVKGKWNYIARCIPATRGACILPPYPTHGRYTVAGVANAAPGQAFVSVSLAIVCDIGYGISGRKDRTCYSGIWSGQVTNCVEINQLCVLPQNPAFGKYIVTGINNPFPEQTYDAVILQVICDKGYESPVKTDITCRKGKWSSNVPDCEPLRPDIPSFGVTGSNQTVEISGFCQLEKDPSVTYRCLLSAASRATRECNLIEPVGTIVRPECKVPNYYFPGILNHMRCYEGKWNYIAKCVPECGVVTPKGTELVVGGRAAERGELPWHAAIYQKRDGHKRQICGGSIISPRVVISAGHCFLENRMDRLPASMFAVAVGKLYRDWDDAKDDEAQHFELSDLIIPPRFQGTVTNFQEDIALLVLMRAIVYQKHIRPVCLDFDPVFESEQLRDGSLGKVAGWGLTSENDVNGSSYLKVVELPFVPIDECQADSPLHFREYITGDKICAGYRNGTAVCKGDSGGGLAFPRQENDKNRFYLRGLVSTAPNNNTLCNALWLTMFTQISRHERFIKDHI